MGRILTLKEAQQLKPGQEKAWAYGALDVTGTRDVWDVLHPRLNDKQARTYRFERALQAPAFAMMTRGVPVDTHLRSQMVTQLKRDLAKAERDIGKMEIVNDVWDAIELETGYCPAQLGKRHKWPRGVPDAERQCERCGVSRTKRKPFEPNSTHQVKHLFYDLFKVKPQFNKKHEVSVDDEALDRIGAKNPQYKELTDAIRNVRDARKQLGTLNAKLTSDNRYPSSFNVGAAWTGRFSSSKNPFGLGGNLQNIGEQHRSTFIPDPGYTLFYVDLMQAESNVVAHISGDEKYIEAHNQGDVHTYVTRLVWPELPWTWELKQDKKIAKQLPEWDPAPGHDFRFQAKRIQHGSNFGLTPPGIAMIAHIPQKNAREAQANYFQAFPWIRQWQNQMRKRIMNQEPLENIFGRTITLFGRPDDPHTYKQGLAFIPQSSVADLLNTAMLKVWDKYDPRTIQLFAQVHDALLGQIRSDKLDAMAMLIDEMAIPVPVNGRIMRIGVEAAIGMNWGHKSEKNPHGLVEFP